LSFFLGEHIQANLCVASAMFRQWLCELEQRFELAAKLTLQLTAATIDGVIEKLREIPL